MTLGNVLSDSFSWITSIFVNCTIPPGITAIFPKIYINLIKELERMLL